MGSSGSYASSLERLPEGMGSSSSSGDGALMGGDGVSRRGAAVLHVTLAPVVGVVVVVVVVLEKERREVTMLGIGLGPSTSSFFLGCVAGNGSLGSGGAVMGRVLGVVVVLASDNMEATLVYSAEANTHSPDNQHCGTSNNTRYLLETCHSDGE
ncbi:hypothetical protein E2C01_015544 [Portunus trituberculatus]|uniref:Uncharacterized protein n=1 Tax=Portunus trituberculatus TaxID=210409 RepID=A0A5B7DM68_PORTR|nr:hypothetical protein [Portunus trituberculatus]